MELHDRKKMGFAVGRQRALYRYLMLISLHPTSGYHSPVRHIPMHHATTRVSSTSQVHQDRPRAIQFVSPLLDEGYPPAVAEFEAGTLEKKPLLLYLPGFDGTWLAPFLQLPELGTTFDVRCLTMTMEDRSTYAELKADVIEYVRSEITQSLDQDTEEQPLSRFFGGRLSPSKRQSREIYLAGESFGGILASDVALALLEDADQLNIDIRGLTLINAATCFDRSKLASLGPKVAEFPRLLYPFGLLRLLPLFTDEYSLAQLLLIFRAKALPSVIDSAQREAYMGRVALSLPTKLKYLPQETLEWRLTEWLETGCESMGEMEGFSSFPSFRTLIIAGENDLCLPSISEAERLSSIFSKSHVHVVEGAGHASTCGSRLDLAALMRKRFPELKGRNAMKLVAAQGTQEFLGMEPRYDGKDDIGLSPLKYWDNMNYRKPPVSTPTTK